MNEQLQEQLSAILALMQESLEKASGAATEELPILLEQLLLWKRIVLSIELGVVFVWFLLSLIVLFLFARSVWRQRKTYKDVSVEMMGVAISSISGVGSLGVCLGKTLPEFLQITLAPHVFLLEYARGLLS